MQPYPHVYTVEATTAHTGAVTLSAPGLASLTSWPPAEFDGPGDAWSPETLLVGAIADCYVLTLRAVARAAGLPWTGVQCRVEAVLERVDGVTRFTRYTETVCLRVPDEVHREAGMRALERAKKACLIANSLHAEGELIAEVVVDADG